MINAITPDSVNSKIEINRKSGVFTDPIPVEDYYNEIPLYPEDTTVTIQITATWSIFNQEMASKVHTFELTVITLWKS